MQDSDTAAPACLNDKAAGKSTFTLENLGGFNPSGSASVQAPVLSFTSSISLSSSNLIQTHSLTSSTSVNTASSTNNSSQSYNFINSGTGSLQSMHNYLAPNMEKNKFVQWQPKLKYNCEDWVKKMDDLDEYNETIINQLEKVNKKIYSKLNFAKK